MQERLLSVKLNLWRAILIIMVMNKRHGLPVPRAGDRSILRDGFDSRLERSYLTYLPGDCLLEERKLTSQSPSINVEFISSIKFENNLS